MSHCANNQDFYHDLLQQRADGVNLDADIVMEAKDRTFLCHYGMYPCGWLPSSSHLAAFSEQSDDEQIQHMREKHGHPGDSGLVMGVRMPMGRVDRTPIHERKHTASALCPSTSAEGDVTHCCTQYPGHGYAHICTCGHEWVEHL